MSTVAPESPHRIGGLSPDAVSSLFQAIGGLRNHRALAAMATCLIGAVLIGMLGGAALGRLGALGVLLIGGIVLVAVYTGINAAGILLMDQARGAPPRGLIDALVFGLLCIPKVIVLAIGFFLVALAVFLAIALVFLVCKIPLLGPIVFTLAFPVSVLVAGVTLSGLMLCMFLALPAVWEGATITHAIAQSLAIVRSRLVETFLMLMVVGFLAFVVGLIVFGVLGSGLFPTMGLSAALLGGGGGGDLEYGMRGGPGPFGALMGGMMGAGGGYALAGAIGGGVLWAIAATLVAQVWLLGLNLVYLRVSEGLDAQATEQAIGQRLAEARRKTAEMRQKAREAAERARDQARSRGAAATPTAPTSAAPAPDPAAPTPVAPAAAAAAPAPGPTPAALTCPACRAPITADDLFCGACGHKLG
jgi:hypothetical protein